MSEKLALKLNVSQCFLFEGQHMNNGLKKKGKTREKENDTQKHWPMALNF